MSNLKLKIIYCLTLILTCCNNKALNNNDIFDETKYKLLTTINNRHNPRIKIIEIYIHKENKNYKLQKMYWLNGVLMSKFFVSKGKLNGPSVSYNQSGILTLKANYLNGQFDGYLIYYNSDGTVKKCKFYKNGELINDNCPN